jgi:hypothetical protein
MMMFMDEFWPVWCEFVQERAPAQSFPVGIAATGLLARYPGWALPSRTVAVQCSSL